MAELAVALATRGHGITVFSSKLDQSILPAATWYRVPMIPRPHLLRFLSFLVMNTLVRMAVWLFKGERYDIVHSTGPDVLHPTVTTFHCCATGMADILQRKNGDPFRESWGSRVRRLSNVIAYRVTAVFEQYVVRSGARRVLAVSQTLAFEINAYYGPLRQPPVVIPNGVNLREFCPVEEIGGDEPCKMSAIAADRLVALFRWIRLGTEGPARAGSCLGASKGTAPNLLTHLVVVGGKGTTHTTERILVLLQGNIQFLGKRSDMPRIYRSADLCVLPTNEEPFGLLPLEAMACGVPAIVSRCAGVAEIITDGTDGLLLKNPEDPEELASKIEGVLSNQELRQLMGTRARKTAEQYSWEEIARRVELVYREILAGQA